MICFVDKIGKNLEGSRGSVLNKKCSLSGLVYTQKISEILEKYEIGLMLGKCDLSRNSSKHFNEQNRLYQVYASCIAPSYGKGIGRALEADFAWHDIGFGEENQRQDQEHWKYILIGNDRWVKLDSICSSVVWIYVYVNDVISWCCENNEIIYDMNYVHLTKYMEYACLV